MFRKLDELRRNRRRLVSLALAFAMTVTQAGPCLGPAGIAYAAGEKVEALYGVEMEELAEAVREIRETAREDRDRISLADLDMAASKRRVKKEYENLFKKDLYPLWIDMDDNCAAESTAVQAFYREESEEIVFLFINGSDMTVDFRVYAGGLETDPVSVAPHPANIDAEDGEEIRAVGYAVEGYGEDAAIVGEAAEPVAVDMALETGIARIATASDATAVENEEEPIGNMVLEAGIAPIATASDASVAETMEEPSEEPAEKLFEEMFFKFEDEQELIDDSELPEGEWSGTALGLVSIFGDSCNARAIRVGIEEHPLLQMYLAGLYLDEKDDLSLDENDTLDANGETISDSAEGEISESEAEEETEKTGETEKPLEPAVETDDLMEGVKYFVLNPTRGIPESGAAQGRSNYFPNNSNNGGVPGCNAVTGYPGGGLTRYAVETVEETRGRSIFDQRGFDDTYLVVPENLGDFNDQTIAWYVIKKQRDGWHVDGYVKDVDIVIVYDANDPEGVWKNESFMQETRTGQDTEVLSYADTGLPQREGYRFSHWSTKKKGNGARHDAGAWIMPFDRMYLYAQWIKEEKPEVPEKPMRPVEPGSEGEYPVPGIPEKPMRPVEPGSEGEYPVPGIPEKPMRPVEPGSEGEYPVPGIPEKPMRPVEPGSEGEYPVPGIPEKPMRPVEPGSEGEYPVPGIPEKPVRPVEPGSEGEYPVPGIPEKPMRPVEPGSKGEYPVPGIPEKPMRPVEPGSEGEYPVPGIPEKPMRPIEPGSEGEYPVPGIPEKPMRPVEPGSEGEYPVPEVSVKPEEAEAPVTGTEAEPKDDSEAKPEAEVKAEPKSDPESGAGAGSTGGSTDSSTTGSTGGSATGSTGNSSGSSSGGSSGRSSTSSSSVVTSPSSSERPLVTFYPEEVPLASLPPQEMETFTQIDDSMVPLALLPKTGDSSQTAWLAILSFLSLVGMGALEWGISKNKQKG